MREDDYRWRLGTRLAVKRFNPELYAEQTSSLATKGQRIALSLSWQPAID